MRLVLMPPAARPWPAARLCRRASANKEHAFGAGRIEDLGAHHGGEAFPQHDLCLLDRIGHARGFGILIGDGALGHANMDADLLLA
jgi:hypothetical protein